MKAALLALTAVMLAATQAPAYTVVLQASDYIASHNADGADFYTTPCGGATNGLGVEGYDYAGDWIELKMVINTAGTYRDSLRVAADDGLVGNHIVTVFDPGGVPVGTSQHQTTGLGIGWRGAFYSRVAGSGFENLSAGTYIVRLELVSGGRHRLDNLTFTLDPGSGVEPTTWGQIKALWR